MPKNLLCLTLTLARRFPNPIPSGTRVPGWALLDVTVRCYAFFSDSLLIARSRKKTIGTTTNRLPSVVRIFSFLFPSLPVTVLHPCLFSIDSNELGPGETIGPSHNGVEHNSHVGAIVGGVVGGIAAISILAAGLFLYRRRRRLRPASAGGGVFSSQMDEIQRPMSGQEPFGSSLPEITNPLMKPYVRVFVPPSFACVLIVFA